MSNFWGTSAATPLCAGIGALVLSAQPQLTWVEARKVMRHTAVKIDPDQNDEVGQWLDVNGEPSRISGLPPHYSQWYGYGRLDAAAAVAEALAYTFPRDLMIRDDLADEGTSPTTPSADSPDIWVRTTDPALDTGAEPAAYSSPGPHQTPDHAGEQWIYARVKNRGTADSLDAWVRFYIASFDGTPFEHPKDWEPNYGLDNVSPGVWRQPGTYFIGEVALPAIAAGADMIVNIPWPNELLPPPDSYWDPYLLVEITPHDGPLTGTRINENNNLAQKQIRIVDTGPPIVEFLDPHNKPMAQTILIPSNELKINLPMQIKIGDLGFFDTESVLLNFKPTINFPLQIKITDRGLFDVTTVRFRVIWYAQGGTSMIVNFDYDYSWVPDHDAPTKVQFMEPMNSSGDPVEEEVPEAIVSGSIQLTGEFEKIEIQVNVTDSSKNNTNACQLFIM